MNRDFAKFIGNQLGWFKDVETDNSEKIWGSSLRIRVSLNITKPLKRVLRIRTEIRDDLLVSFTYEKFTNFCYFCGCLGHLSKYCELQLKEDFVDPGDATPFGPWLRASNNTYVRNKIQATNSQSSTAQNQRPSFIINSMRSSNSRTGITMRGPSVFGSFNSSSLPSENVISTPIDHVQTTIHSTSGANTHSHIVVLEENPNSNSPTPSHISQSSNPNPYNQNMYGLAVNSIGRSRGLALLWKKSINVVIQSYSTRHIDASVQSDTDAPTWRFSGIYGEPETTQRKKTQNLLNRLKAQSIQPWLCMGDFNEILDNSEKEGVNICPFWQIRDFGTALDTNGLFGIGYSGYPFTWCNGQESPNTIRERLDRACADDKWIQLFPRVNVSHHPNVHSDHSPIVLQTELTAIHSHDALTDLSDLRQHGQDMKNVMRSSRKVGIKIRETQRGTRLCHDYTDVEQS
ncbi:UNVERIFIED_CONTAM: hypothetical protein Sradi_6204300 [Sesamum radiatum]|uniref:CCHC-type domain-containing protein n=1 Tax=Sesamum radiatum TaxID=300843 RepID=A0AAW2K943_SESRA